MPPSTAAANVTGGVFIFLAVLQGGSLTAAFDALARSAAPSPPLGSYGVLSGVILAALLLLCALVAAIAMLRRRKPRAKKVVGDDDEPSLLAGSKKKKAKAN